ncbi:MAG: VWA domain-containing protein [Pseudomonadota bacterium]
MPAAPRSASRAPGASRTASPGASHGGADARPRPRLEDIYAAGLESWARAERIAALLAVDPRGLGGVHVIGGASYPRTAWLGGLHALFPTDTPAITLPAPCTDDTLIGGIALDRSLAAGSLVAEPGLLARADGGLLTACLAERMEPARAALIAGAMDDGLVRVERAGHPRTDRAAFALLLLDSGEPGEPPPPPSVTDRVAFAHTFRVVPSRCASSFETEPGDILAARRRLASITAEESAIEAIAQAATQLGCGSLRAPLFVLRAARAAAALDGRATVSDTDLAEAASLVLAHRSAPPPDAAPEPPPEPDPPQADSETEADPSEPDRSDPGTLEDQLIAAVESAALAQALETLATAVPTATSNASNAGRSGEAARKQDNGRPDRPVPRARMRKGRIDLLATLRTAAPFQTLRSQQRPSEAGTGPALQLRASDLRVKTYRHRTETSVIFLVDASGSSALNRMGEAKGAIEYLLSDCYSRRDHVALIAVRGAVPDLLLAPTRALTRVRRALSDLPSGGTTPLAGGLSLAAETVERERRAGRTPFLVILSDGRGNVAINGSTERDIATADLETAARHLAAQGAAALFFDTSRRPNLRAQALAGKLGAQYRHLSHTSAQTLSRTVRTAIGSR